MTQSWCRARHSRQATAGSALQSPGEVGCIGLPDEASREVWEPRRAEKYERVIVDSCLKNYPRYTRY